MRHNLRMWMSAIVTGVFGAWAGFWLLVYGRCLWQYLTHTVDDDDLLGGIVGLPGIPLGFFAGVAVAVWIGMKVSPTKKV